MINDGPREQTFMMAFEAAKGRSPTQGEIDSANLSKETDIKFNRFHQENKAEKEQMYSSLDDYDSLLHKGSTKPTREEINKQKSKTTKVVRGFFQQLLPTVYGKKFKE